MTRDRNHLLVDGLLLLALGAALLWAAVSGAQPAPLNLNGQPLTAVLCDGGVVCSRRGSVATIIVTASGSGGSSSSDYDGGYLVVQDEGSSLARRSTLNFTGAGITCSDTGGVTVCTVSGGGGGGSVNVASGVASFDGGSFDALTTVTAAWATPSSTIVCSPTGEEASVEGLVTTVVTRGSGSFVVRSEPRERSHWGDLPFLCIGD